MTKLDQIRDRLQAAFAPASLEVRDDGPGIANELRDRLFEPYVTTRASGEGMGLGLAISRKILLDHGGDLELAHSSPRGTTMRCWFPPVDHEEAGR